MRPPSIAIFAFPLEASWAAAIKFVSNRATETKSTVQISFGARCSANGCSAHILRSTASRYLQISEAVQPPKTLIVHVQVLIAGLALVNSIQTLAAVSRSVLSERGEPTDGHGVFDIFRTLASTRRSTTSLHDRTGFSLTQTCSLQCLHRLLSLRWPQPFLINSFIASIFSVWRAMIRCICRFSDSSCLSRTTSPTSMSLYFDFQSRIVLA
jgi:hypothetical protein